MNSWLIRLLIILCGIGFGRIVNSCDSVDLIVAFYFLWCFLVESSIYGLVLIFIIFVFSLRKLGSIDKFLNPFVSPLRYELPSFHVVVSAAFSSIGVAVPSHTPLLVCQAQQESQSTSLTRPYRQQTSRSALVYTLFFKHSGVLILITESFRRCRRALF